MNNNSIYNSDDKLKNVHMLKTCTDNLNKNNNTEICDISYNISTITISCKILDTELNIINIGKYLDIDNQIIGIKYYYGEYSFCKGIYTTTTYKKSKKKKIESINQALFYNQISLTVLLNGKQINVKLFRNGSLHITGCKSIDDGRDVTILVYNKILTLIEKTHQILLTVDKYGVLFDSNNFIYNRFYDKNNTCYNIIGFYNTVNNTYIMNNKEYIVYNKLKNTFISKNKEPLNIKTICNNNGKIIGEKSCLKNNKKNGLSLYDSQINSNCSNEQLPDVVTTDCYKIINYKCDPFIQKNKLIRFNDMFFSNDLCKLIQVNVDCINITISLDTLINRQKLYNFFIKNNYICKYNPQSYSGIKLIYKYSFYENENELICNDYKSYGICNCSMKCICSNITFLIFQSGSVIVSGCKSLIQIEKVVYNFKKIIDMYQELV